MNAFLYAGAIAAASTAIIVGGRTLWRQVLCPLWSAINALAAFTEARPVLQEIADEFKPNGGTSLRDQIDELKIGQRNLQQMFENHIIGVSPWDGETERRNGTDRRGSA